MSAPCTEDDIRKDERRRLAALLEAHIDTLAAYACDTEGAIRLVALLIRLSPSEDDTPPEPLTVHTATTTDCFGS